jgi:hypothetical protein
MSIGHRLSGGDYCLYIWVYPEYSCTANTLQVEAKISSETEVIFYQMIRVIPEN